MSGRHLVLLPGSMCDADLWADMASDLERTLIAARYSSRELSKLLHGLFLPDEDRDTYAEGLRRGGCLVTVRTDDDHCERALEILDEDGTIDMDQRSPSGAGEAFQIHATRGTGK